LGAVVMFRGFSIYSKLPPNLQLIEKFTFKTIKRFLLSLGKPSCRLFLFFSLTFRWRSLQFIANKQETIRLNATTLSNGLDNLRQVSKQEYPGFGLDKKADDWLPWQTNLLFHVARDVEMEVYGAIRSMQAFFKLL
jgi:hypothetical protein